MSFMKCPCFQLDDRPFTCKKQLELPYYSVAEREVFASSFLQIYGFDEGGTSKNVEENSKYKRAYIFSEVIV